MGNWLSWEQHERETIYISESEREQERERERERERKSYEYEYEYTAIQRQFRGHACLAVGRIQNAATIGQSML